MMIKKDSAMLVLADGITWQIVSGDKRASKIVSGLRQVLQLKSANAACRRVIALTGDNDIMPYEDGVKIYIPNNSQLKTVEIYKLLLEPICIDIEDHLGLFIHGALAEYEGMGVILAGPGGAGKTTASNRLPRPWQSLSDDLTLVVRDLDGMYWAHPWPTWSRFLSSNGGGSWDVSKAVLLKGVFFLNQSEEDHVCRIGCGEAVCNLVHITEQAAWWRQVKTEKAKGTSQRLKRFEAICAMARSMSCFILTLSLTGPFWDEIISALDVSSPRKAN